MDISFLMMHKRVITLSAIGLSLCFLLAYLTSGAGSAKSTGSEYPGDAQPVRMEKIDPGVLLAQLGRYQHWGDAPAPVTQVDKSLGTDDISEFIQLIGVQEVAGRTEALLMLAAKTPAAVKDSLEAKPNADGLLRVSSGDLVTATMRVADVQTTYVEFELEGRKIRRYFYSYQNANTELAAENESE